MQDVLIELGHTDFSSPLWTAFYLRECPEEIVRAHKRYYEAGANIVITSSYKTTLPLLMEYMHLDSEKKAEDIMQTTTELAIQARNELIKEGKARGEMLVAASIGPYAVEEFIYPYDGSYGARLGVEGLVEYHKPRFEVLVDRTQPDILAVETIVCLNEVRAILQLLKTRPLAKAWISVICNSEHTLNSGETVEDFAKLIEEEDVNGQVEAIGANCTQLDFIT